MIIGRCRASARGGWYSTRLHIIGSQFEEASGGEFRRGKPMEGLQGGSLKAKCQVHRHMLDAPPRKLPSLVFLDEDGAPKKTQQDLTLLFQGPV